MSDVDRALDLGERAATAAEDLIQQRDEAVELARLADASRAEARALADSLAEAAQSALDHVVELEDAWMRGIIREGYRLGGTRSNRNADVRMALRRAMDAYRASKQEAGEGT